MDIRRMNFTRSLVGRRPWQHKRIKHALAVIVFAVPNLLLSVALVPASHAARTSPYTLRLASFGSPGTHWKIALFPVAPVAPVAPPAPPPAPVVVTATPVPAPAAPVPAPSPPAVDSSSAAAWAASPSVACIRESESGDNYSTNTGNGYYGAYQDLLSTWVSHGGTGLPSDAPPAVQDEINYEIWLSGGWGQWGTAGACGL